MSREIERKFLVTDDRWMLGATGVRFRQGYLAVGPPASVRVRIAGGKAFLNIKESTIDISRREFEYPLPLEDAQTMLDALRQSELIEKTRYEVLHAGMRWEIDVFEKQNAGLVVAEIELSHREQEFDPPPWLGNEISGDPRYFNSSLSITPYSKWPENLHSL